VEFFKQLRAVAPRFLPIFAEVLQKKVGDLERKLEMRELQMGYVFTSVIMKRYTDLFASRFELSTPSHPASDPNFRLGWLLFLLGRAELLPTYPDLVSCYHLLLAACNVLLVHMPRRRLRLKLTDPLTMCARTSDGRVDTLMSLALAANSIPSEVSALAAKLDALLIPTLKAAGLPPSTHPEESRSVATSCTYFPGLLDDSETRKDALEALEGAYRKSLEARGGLYDEQVFLEPDHALGATSPLCMSPRVSQWHPPRTSLYDQRNIGHMPSPLRHSLRGGGAAISSDGYCLGAIGRKSSVDGTGMSEQLSATAWLRELASVVQAEPSDDLRQYLSAGGTDRTQEVAERVNMLADSVFPSDTAEGQALAARRDEAIKVYYRVLESILASEEQRTGSSDMGSLLKSNTFHKCLLACSCEVVVAAYRMIIMPFPEILGRLGLRAFDIFKIVQTFVRHEPTLPREVRRHLVSLEEQVVESLAWWPGSSLFPALAAAKAQTDKADSRSSQLPARKRTLFPRSEDDDARSRSSAEEPEVTCPKGLKKLKTRVSALKEAEQMSRPAGSPTFTPPPRLQISSPFSHAQNSAFQVVASPASARPAGSEGPQPSPSMPRSSLPQCIGHGIEAKSRADPPVVQLVREFFRKTTILSAIRLAQLCEMIDLQPYDHTEILHKVYSIARFAIFERTSLLYGRHLDQLLLCSLYGVCKVLRLDRVTFKEVTTQYRKLAGSAAGASGGSRQDVFRSVVIRFADQTLQPAEVGDIITFYNKVFIPAMKEPLMGIADAQGPASPDSAAVNRGGRRRSSAAGSPLCNASRGAPFPLPLSPRKMQVSGDCNVFVSSMREPGMTPRTRSLYCGGDGRTVFNTPSPLGAPPGPKSWARPAESGPGTSTRYEAPASAQHSSGGGSLRTETWRPQHQDGSQCDQVSPNSSSRRLSGAESPGADSAAVKAEGSPSAKER